MQSLTGGCFYSFSITFFVSFYIRYHGCQEPPKQSSSFSLTAGAAHFVVAVGDPNRGKSLGLACSCIATTRLIQRKALELEDILGR